MAVLFKDITAAKRAEQELRESEARFRNMADNAPVMIWVTRPDGYCEYLNKQWYDFTGQTVAEATGFGWVDATHPDDKARAENAFLEANAAQAPSRSSTPRRRDGEWRWAIDAASPRFGDGGDFLGYVGTVIDITDRALAERERESLLAAERAARAEAERASNMKDEFLATLSHELRTRSTRSSAGLKSSVAASRTPTTCARGWTSSSATARAQTQIIEDLLDMSRIISGKVRLDVQEVDLESVVRASIETVRPAADAKNVRVQAVLDPLAKPVSGDPQPPATGLLEPAQQTPSSSRPRAAASRSCSSGSTRTWRST